jgi:hypothetical protein
MAENTKKNSQIDEGDTVRIEGPTTTTVTPAEADKTSASNALDAKPNDPPVRTNRPDVPIAGSLAAGAGQHHPRIIDQTNAEGVEVDKDGFDRDGRFQGVPSTAKG